MRRPVPEGGARRRPRAVRVVFEVCQSLALLARVGSGGIGFERLAVPVADEVLSGRGRVDRENPSGLAAFALDLHGEEVGALPNGRDVSDRPEIGLKLPVLQVGRGIERDFVFVGLDQDHRPALRLFVPEDFGVSEALRFDVQDGRAAVVKGPCSAVVRGIGQRLRLDAARIVVARPNRDHGGIVRGPESRRVAGVDDGGAREDAVLVGSGYGDSLFFPMHEVAGDGVPPRHVSPVRSLRIVLVEKVVLALVVDESVGIVHPVALGRVVGEGAPRVVCVNWRGDRGGVCGSLSARGLRVGRGGSPRRRR